MASARVSTHTRHPAVNVWKGITSHPAPLSWPSPLLWDVRAPERTRDDLDIASIGDIYTEVGKTLC